MDAMVLALVLSTLLAVLFASIGVGVLCWHLARSNRLAIDIETGAPVGWVWSARPSARLHRRLRTAVRMVHEPMTARQRRDERPAVPGSAADLIAEMTCHAVRLDRELILAARLPRPLRRTRLHHLDTDVRAVERLALRLRHHRERTARSTLPGFAVAPSHEVIGALTQRLDILDAAHDELAAIDDASVEHDPEVVLRRIAPRPAPVATRRLRPATLVMQAPPPGVQAPRRSHRR